METKTKEPELTADQLHKKNLEELHNLELMLEAFAKQIQEFEAELQERKTKK